MLRLFRKTGRTFDFTRRTWGQSIEIAHSDNEAEVLYFTGHSQPRPGKHDILLTQDRAGNQYRWQIISIEYYDDPGDMWLAGVKLMPSGG